MQFPIYKRKLIRGFNEHINSNLGGAADYTAPIGTPIYSPFYGTIYQFHEEKGGTWIGIKREDGMRFEFAHLSKYAVVNGAKVVPGQLIAISGNSGTETTGPHVHHQIINAKGERIDPEHYYFATNIPLIAVNGTIDYMHKVQDKLLEYSAGMLTCSWDIIQHPIAVQHGLLTQAEAYALADILNNPAYLPYRYILMFYQGNLTSTMLATYYYPKLDQSISTIPGQPDPRLVVFELGHQLAGYLNENTTQIPPIPYLDTNYPTDSVIIEKLRLAEPQINQAVGL